MSGTSVEVITKESVKVEVTGKAVQEIRRLKSDNNIPEEHALRIGVKGGGCSGMTYVLAFDEAIREGDVVYDVEGVKIQIDPRSMEHLSGTTLDFSDGLSGRGFIFNNPNAKKSCGCGNSFC